MRKLEAFMHMSLDGYAAGPSGEMDWITVDEEIFDYVGERVDKSDTGVYGRVTYGMMQGYWPTAADQPNATKHDIEHAHWYKSAKKVVLSTTLEPSEEPHVTIIADNIADKIRALKSSPGRDMIIFGSPRTSHSLMRLELVDSYWLFVNPIILGGGTPVFEEMGQRTRLKLDRTKTFSSGVVCLQYTQQQSK